MPEVSVIIPVYRAEAFVAECLESVLCQTFRDLEIICVDDGSPDRSGEICRSYAQKDSRVKVLAQANGGQSSARNHALRCACGRWICYVDSDDRIHPQMIEHLYRAAQQSGAAISQCRYLESPEFPGDFDEPREGAYTILPMDEENVARLLDEDRYPGWVACAKLIRRELIESYPFREGRVYEDNEAVCRWIVAAGQIADLSDRLYFYRTNPDSTTKSRFTEKKLDYLWALESILTFYEDLGWAQVTNRFLSRYIDAAAGCCIGARDALSRPDMAKKIIRNTRAFLKQQKFHLTQTQFETLLEAAYPKHMHLYWPFAGILHTLREEGTAGVLRKVSGKLGGK